MKTNTAWSLVFSAGLITSIGATDESSESLADRVEKSSAETDAFFGMWISYNVPLGILDEQRGTRSYKAFERFMALASEAGEMDVNECVARLPDASPRTAALLLCVLYNRCELRLLPTMAQSLDDNRIAFQYDRGSPDTRFARRMLGGVTRPDLPESQTVGDIARTLLGKWGYRSSHESFDEFWEARKDRPYSAMELSLQAARARDSVTGEPKGAQIAALQERIAKLPPPANSLVRLAVGFPTPKDKPSLYHESERRALAALDKKTVIGILHGTDPFGPGDPDFNAEAGNSLRNTVVDRILAHHDVHFTDAEFAEIMKNATPQAKRRLADQKNLRNQAASSPDEIMD